MPQNLSFLTGFCTSWVLLLGTNAYAAGLPDLGIHLISFDPFIAEVPAANLIPLLEARVQAALQPVDEKTKYIHSDEMHISVEDGGLRIRVKGKAGVRVCGKYPWPAHGEFCLPWVEDVFRARVDLSVSVQDWRLAARHEFTDVELANDALDAIKRAMTDDFYRPIHDSINAALEEIDGRDLRRDLEAALEVEIDPSASATVSLSAEAMRLEIR